MASGMRRPRLYERRHGPADPPLRAARFRGRRGRGGQVDRPKALLDLSMELFDAGLSAKDRARDARRRAVQSARSHLDSPSRVEEPGQEVRGSGLHAQSVAPPHLACGPTGHDQDPELTAPLVGQSQAPVAGSPQ